MKQILLIFTTHHIHLISLKILMKVQGCFNNAINNKYFNNLKKKMMMTGYCSNILCHVPKIKIIKIIKMALLHFKILMEAISRA